MSEQDRFRQRNFDAWVQTAIRFFVLANAGAAVATLSFLATWATPGFSRAVGVFVLACFVAGMIAAGITIMGQLTAAYRTFLSDYLDDPKAIDLAIKRSWATKYFDVLEAYTAKLMCLAFGLFTVGSVLGILGLAASIC